MKKFIVAIIVFSIAGLSFLAGGRYWKERPAGAKPQGVTQAGTEAGGEDLEVSLVPGAVTISPARQQLIGVKVAAVEKKPLTYTLRLYGRVVPDETKVYRLNASTDSWVREISGAATGSLVDKDEILAEMLAPAFYNAQNNYLIQLGQMDRIRQQIGGELRPQQTDIADNQIRLSLQNLQTLGISDAQIAELAKTRKARPYLQVRSPARGVVLSRKVTLNQWFKAGEEFYTIADIRKVWVYADVYENEVANTRPGMTVLVKHGPMGKSFSARVGQVLPLFDPASRTLKVRLEVDNLRYDLRPDMFVDVEIPITLPPSLSVPAGAVLDSGTKAIVYVEKGNGIFEPRRVKTGWSFGGQVEIKEGLKAGEKIAVSGNFLIDSESRMELAASGAEPERRPVPSAERDLKKEKGAFETAGIKKRPPGSDTTSVPVKTNKVAPDMGLQPPGAGSGRKDESGQTREGSYPFPGAQYLGTVSRDPAPAEGEPPEDKLPPRQFEIPAVPPSGTRLR
ncbi:MAG: efflux RND transporter periplasmic adaptor subunit [Deltaproteobacteria bacterium]|nr:efflux RND transporter periplasmic adaptor subunit [Deltaproteobacteria bacterium]